MNAVEIVGIIINAIAASFAVVAAVIAVVVYRKSAKLQNRAINYGLLEKRLQIVAYFEHYYGLDASAHSNKKEDTWDRVDTLLGNKTNWEIEAFKMLFSATAVGKYEYIEWLSKEKDKISTKLLNMYLFCNNGRETDEEDIKHDRAEFMKLLSYYEDEYRSNPNNEKTCVALERLSTSGFLSYGNENYFKLLKAEVQSESKRKRLLGEFLCYLRDEVKSSIQ